jgi:hypothetical protein
MKKAVLFHVLPMLALMAFPQLASARQDQSDCCFKDPGGTEVCLKPGDAVTIHNNNGYQVLRINHIWDDGTVDYTAESDSQSTLLSFETLKQYVVVELPTLAEFHEGQVLTIRADGGYKDITINKIWDNGHIQFRYNQSGKNWELSAGDLRFYVVHEVSCDARCAVDSTESSLKQVNQNASRRDEDPRVSRFTRKQLADSIAVLNTKLDEANGKIEKARATLARGAH